MNLKDIKIIQRAMRNTVVFLITAGSVYTLQAQDSLSHYLSQASKTNPVVLQNYAAYEAALQKIAQAGALPDPQLNAGILLRPMEFMMGQQIAEFELMQMFPWFGTLRAAKDEMSLMANAKYEALKDAKLQVFYDVEKNWYELYKLHRYLEISNRNMNILKTIEQLSLSRYKTAGAISAAPSQNNSIPTEQPGRSQNNSGMQGMGGNNPSASSSTQAAPAMNNTSMNGSSEGFGLENLYQIQIEMGNLENSILLLQNRKNALTALFNGYLGRPALTPVYVPDTLIIPDTASLQITEDSLIKNNPMLRMLLLEQQSLEARRTMVMRMGYPMVGVGMNYTILKKNEMSDEKMNGADMVMPMVSVSMPIYRKKYKAMQQEAIFLANASGYQYQAAVSALISEYYQAVQLYEDSRRKISLFLAQSALAQKSLNIQMKTFLGSGSSLTDILRARQQLLDFETKIVEATADLSIAKAWLGRLSSTNTK
jgi:outer membrane protein TolC